MGRPREFSQEERAALTAQGYRRVEIWVVDRENPAYRREAARQVENAAEADRRDPDIDDWTVQLRGDLWDDEQP